MGGLATSNCYLGSGSRPCCWIWVLLLGVDLVVLGLRLGFVAGSGFGLCCWVWVLLLGLGLLVGCGSCFGSGFCKSWVWGLLGERGGVCSGGRGGSGRLGEARTTTEIVKTSLARDASTNFSGRPLLLGLPSRRGRTTREIAGISRFGSG